MASRALVAPPTTYHCCRVSPASRYALERTRRRSRLPCDLGSARWYSRGQQRALSTGTPYLPSRASTPTSTSGEMLTGAPHSQDNGRCVGSRYIGFVFFSDTKLQDDGARWCASTYGLTCAGNGSLSNLCLVVVLMGGFGLKVRSLGISDDMTI